MNKPAIPDFAALLAPYIGTVPAEAIPAFLARLERTAADRYRIWAEALPEHQGGLLQCADREDEIADNIESVLATTDPEHITKMDAAIEPARDCYYQVFSELPVIDQLAIQANAERQGAAAWRAMVNDSNDGKVNQVLEACAKIEEASADYLDQLIEL